MFHMTWQWRENTEFNITNEATNISVNKKFIVPMFTTLFQYFLELCINQFDRVYKWINIKFLLQNCKVNTLEKPANNNVNEIVVNIYN